MNPVESCDLELAAHPRCSPRAMELRRQRNDYINRLKKRAGRDYRVGWFLDFIFTEISVIDRGKRFREHVRGYVEIHPEPLYEVPNA